MSRTASHARTSSASHARTRTSRGGRRERARGGERARTRTRTNAFDGFDGLIPPNIDGDLEGLQEEQGATFDELGYAMNYGDVDGERRAIASGAAVVDRSDWGMMRTSGTGAIKALRALAKDDRLILTAPGTGFEITLESGDVAQVYAQNEGFLLITPPRATAAAFETLASVPDHQVTELNDRCALLTVCGPTMENILRPMGLTGVMEAPTGSHVVFGFENRPVVAAHTPEYGVRGLNLIVDEGIAGQVWATITRSGVVPCGNDASNAALISQSRLK